MLPLLLKVCIRILCRRTSPPFEELHVLGMLDESRPHHDGLETLPVNGPELHVSES